MELYRISVAYIIDEQITTTTRNEFKCSLSEPFDDLTEFDLDVY